MMKLLSLALVLLFVSQTMAISWTNCGPSDPSKIASLDVSPATIALGNPVTVSASAVLSETLSLTNEVSAKLTIQKNEFGVWIDVPCVKNVGSCSYDNICSLIKVDPNKACPLKPFNIPCACPFNAGTYTIPAPGIAFNTSAPSSSLVDGWYKVKAVATSASGSELLCFQVEANITTAGDTMMFQ